MVNSKTLFACNIPAGISLMAVRGISCIKTSVEIAIESHGRTAGKDHAKNN